jgi:hypothetical protein
MRAPNIIYVVTPGAVAGGGTVSAAQEVNFLEDTEIVGISCSTFNDTAAERAGTLAQIRDKTGRDLFGTGNNAAPVPLASIQQPGGHIYPFSKIMKQDQRLNVTFTNNTAGNVTPHLAFHCVEKPTTRGNP